MTKIIDNSEKFFNHINSKGVAQTDWGSIAIAGPAGDAALNVEDVAKGRWNFHSLVDPKRSGNIGFTQEIEDTSYVRNEIVEFNGRNHRVTDEATRKIPVAERIKSAAIGVAAVVPSFGLALLSKDIRNLFTKNRETIQLIEANPVEA